MPGGDGEGHHRQKLEESGVAERKWRPRYRVDLPTDCHRLNLGSEDREKRRTQEAAKVAMRQGAGVCGCRRVIHQSQSLYWNRGAESTFCQSTLISRRLASWTSQRSEITSSGSGMNQSSPSWSSTFVSPTSRSRSIATGKRTATSTASSRASTIGRAAS